MSSQNRYQNICFILYIKYELFRRSLIHHFCVQFTKCMQMHKYKSSAFKEYTFKVSILQYKVCVPLDRTQGLYNADAMLYQRSNRNP